jgi:hypothetical protein
MGYRGRVTWERVWDVLKWVLAALAAGFVGQFGRSLALKLIERRRRRSPTVTREPVGSPSEAERERLAAQAKIEKKRAKAEIKRLKKAPKDDDTKPA